MAAKKKQPVRKREHVYTALLVTGRVGWKLTKISLIVCLAIGLMFLAVVGMLVRGVDT